MIGWKKIFALFSVIIYALLIILFIKSSQVHDVSYELCNAYEKPCIRFCSKNEKSDDELFFAFGKSKYFIFNGIVEEGGKVLTDFFERKFVQYTIYRGEPQCKSMEVNITNYQFDTVK